MKEGSSGSFTGGQVLDLAAPIDERYRALVMVAGFGASGSRSWPACGGVVSTGVTPHDLQHTATSLWILAGTDVKTVSTRAGHSSTSFTLDRYGHLYDGADAQSIARLDSLVGRRVTRPLSDVRPLRP